MHRKPIPTNVSVEHVTKTKVRFRSSLDFMDKLCGTEAIVLDGDNKPGTWFQLTSASKYLPNMNCSFKFRAVLPAQRLVVTVEKMNIVDCPADTLRIYDGTNLLNKDIKQQCGNPTSTFFFTVRSPHESRDEQIDFLSSSFVLDDDQSGDVHVHQ